MMSGGTSPSTPIPTAAYAPTPTASARTSRNSSAPRRRRCTNPMTKPACAIRRPPRPPRGRLIFAARLSTVSRALSRLEESMPSRTWSASKSESRSRSTLERLVGLGQVDAGQRRVDPAVDDDDAVLLADVVLVLAPRPRGRRDHPEPHRQDEQREQPEQPGVAARWAGRVAGRLRVRDRVAGDRERDVVGDLGAHRLELTGVTGAVAAEQGCPPWRRGSGAACPPPRPRAAG